VTGETRPYDAASGVFRGISPARPVGQSGRGGWEWVARYSEMDLNDGSIGGGRERNATLGLGWYANDFVRISGNWVHVSDIDGGIRWRVTRCITDAVSVRLLSRFTLTINQRKSLWSVFISGSS